MKWELTPLKNITTKIGSGATPRGGENSYQAEGITLIRSLNVYDFEFKYDGLAFIDEKQALETRLARVIVKPQDLLLNITGASVARCCIVPEHLLPARVNQHVMLVRVDSNHADPYYVLYCINGPVYKTQLLTLAQGGTTREALTKEIIGNFEIPLPPLPTQRKIAAVLSAYDDLIDNNTRRIQILEEMARAIYREWFVHFRFPGHETVKLVESAVGLIPEGGEVKTLGEACEIVMGQSPKSEFYNETGEGLPFHQGVKDFGQRFPTDRVYCTVQNRIAEAGDILFSVRAPVGRINIANKRIVIGRGLCAIRDKNENQAFIFHQLKEKFQEEDIMGGGTIFKAVTKADMLGIQIILPTGSLIAKFEQIAKPIFSELENLTAKNANLRRTRDLLLPKLISGEIDVSDVDIDIGFQNINQDDTFPAAAVSTYSRP